jgi:hypothetical protein
VGCVLAVCVLVAPLVGLVGYDRVMHRLRHGDVFSRILRGDDARVKAYIGAHPEFDLETRFEYWWPMHHPAIGRTPLMAAIGNARFGLAHWLVERGASVEPTPDGGPCPLYWAVQWFGTDPDAVMPLVRAMLDRGAPLGSPCGSEGETPIGYVRDLAVWRGEGSEWQALLDVLEGSQGSAWDGRTP